MRPRALKHLTLITGHLPCLEQSQLCQEPPHQRLLDLTSDQAHACLAYCRVLPAQFTVCILPSLVTAEKQSFGVF